MDPRVLGAMAAPFAAAAAIYLGRRRGAEAWTYAAAGVSLALALALLPAVRAGVAPEVRLMGLLPGVDLFFRVDPLGLTFALLAAGLWVVTSVYSSGYVRAMGLENRRRYFACFAASIGCALGVAFAGNVLTFLVFYEGLTLATYPLVAHKETDAALAGARRYLAYALTGGLALTAAAAWTWMLAGTLDFVPGGFLPPRLAGGALAGLFALYAIGYGVKAAVMPLHAWLPGAMVAPTPVSALLHAVAVVKAGVFGCLRMVQYVFGPDTLSSSAAPAVLIAACGVTVVAGSIAALRQDNLKRRLAYSTVVHLSLIVLGAALLAPHGTVGAMLHMVNHGFAKITLFFCAGAIYASTHAETVSRLGGLGRHMPWTFAAFTVASLALVGFPGLCGFVGKLILARGAIEASQMVPLAILLGGSLFTAAYLLPIVRAAYFDPAPNDAVREAPGLMVGPLVATSALVVVFGALPAVINLQYELAARAAAQIFGGAP
ncbi:MAG: monovalent cation/H+ antiporter subunit D family protein [Planctomycetes bacterium]|nr:monovalent cation/H+ antiporter subunit D family protein [Planctomycetota bacterium]